MGITSGNPAPRIVIVFYVPPAYYPRISCMSIILVTLTKKVEFIASKMLMHIMCYKYVHSKFVRSVVVSCIFLCMHSIPWCSICTAIVEPLKTCFTLTILSRDSDIYYVQYTGMVATLRMFVWAERFDRENCSIFSFSRHLQQNALALQTAGRKYQDICHAWDTADFHFTGTLFSPFLQCSQSQF